MLSSSRREFLATALGGLGVGLLSGADKPAEPVKTIRDDPPFQPSTLFLTWQRDPTTTMTVQWVGAAGETADPTVTWAPAEGGPWEGRPPAVRPYPLTDFKVFRAELTGLTPGTDYLFRVGKRSPTYRFRTMPAKATDAI